eukprot:TRINITY_DN6932_c0_g1_i1.p1 TRINITY_DN6932_c0_g1~~TRINITY_DN6932_c0_g1_i1.p1  ORF type:complete len:804 (+),score=148.17 TRINITY_DN6932_c0_g1_i1:64-2412(+)
MSGAMSARWKGAGKGKRKHDDERKSKKRNRSSLSQDQSPQGDVERKSTVGGVSANGSGDGSGRGAVAGSDRTSQGAPSTKRTDGTPTSKIQSPGKNASPRDRALFERQKLPIWEVKDQLLDQIRANESVILIGETGSGKTTQLPQFLDACNSYTKPRKVVPSSHSPRDSKKKPVYRRMMIGITQPRRIAAISVAQRVAFEMGYNVGEEVGYAVRFDDTTSRKTRLKYMTDGLLLREAMLDSKLSRYSVIILDEAHERTLQTDILFGLVRSAQESRRTSNDPLKLIVMSATLDADTFSTYFNAKVLYVQGRQFPVEILYTFESQADYIDAALIAILQVHIQEAPGDVLVFLTGRDDIESLEKLLNERADKLPVESMKLIPCPIYSGLPTEQQIKVFDPAPAGCRKVILATNIAETSLTITGIKYVIDTGVVKAKIYTPKTGIDSLKVIPISKQQARQRSGRAGREASGKCYRLFTEDQFETLRNVMLPEIQRCKLDSVVLQLKAMGIADPLTFKYMDAPPVPALKRSLETLYNLQALSTENEVTQPLGQRMAELPLDPMFARALLAAETYSCLEQVLTVVSMLAVEADKVFFTPTKKRKQALAAQRRFRSDQGDHLTLLSVFRGYVSAPRQNKVQWCRENFVNIRTLKKALDVRGQLAEYLVKFKMAPTKQSLDVMPSRVEGVIEEDSDDVDDVKKAILSGFFLQVARLQQDGRSYGTVTGNKTVHIHPSSCLFDLKPRPDCVLYNELIMTTKLYMRDVLAVEQAWLPDVAPQYFKRGASMKG